MVLIFSIITHEIILAGQTILKHKINSLITLIMNQNIFYTFGNYYFITYKTTISTVWYCTHYI